MKEKVQSALNNYVLAYSNNDKDLFRSLWDEEAVFEDPVGSEPCVGIEAICAFWDFGHSNGMEIKPVNVETVICANEGILKAVMEVRNTADNSGMDISIVDHFIVNENGKIVSGRAGGVEYFFLFFFFPPKWESILAYSASSMTS